ncbi:AAA family ATPase [Nannocystis bainbridge]|uniref:AAA family ATPase n=1 Tax=Nannocystis bainbridge TaxID=2995303 RepID=A0ABT5EAQ3_9BACT|nr:AAA family ATPase [Nannocystis bainbridge]MDC0722948.1 AAA family ATPase [Nannocystis bainbridge]
MSSPAWFIRSVSVQKFGCLKDVNAALTPLHAFIGPNDSGKSTLLRALRTAMHLVRRSFIRAPNDEIQPFDPGPLCSGTAMQLAFGPDRAKSHFNLKILDEGNFAESGGSKPLLASQRSWIGPRSTKRGSTLTWPPEILPLLDSGARLVHLNPSSLREPSELIPEGGGNELIDEYGRGLPAIYDAILNRGDDAFLRMVEGVRRLFPTIKAVRLKVMSKSTKALEVELVSGERVPAAFLSEGLLFYLAFAALQHLDPVALLLIEEPENGLHPARIADVMRILREISSTTQVVLTTHSPLVINEMQGDEVSVVTRDRDKGTMVRRLDSTPNFIERSKVYALGELWLSYANGDDEGPLLTAQVVT